MGEAEVRLDVRSIPVKERHARIFATFESLSPGRTLTVVSDHEPRPLRAEFGQRYPGKTVWNQRQIGDGRWEARIERVAHIADSIADTLRQSNMLAGAGEATVLDLAHYTRRAVIKRHHCVVEQRINWPYIGLVDRGMVQAQIPTATGRSQAVYDAFPGDTFGEFALLDRGAIALRFVAVLAGTAVLLIPIDRFRAVMQRERCVAKNIEQAAAQHARATIERYTTHIELSSTARVASALLPFASPGDGLTLASAHLPSMTQTDLATSAGTVKEVVSRALAEMDAFGAVRRQAGHIYLLDRAKLLTLIQRG